MPRAPSSNKNKGRAVVREPVQVYLTADDAGLLTRLAEESGLSKAEVLRRGVRSYARELGQQSQSPMLRFLEGTSPEDWPRDVAANHDAVLAESYRGPRKKRK